MNKAIDEMEFEKSAAKSTPVVAPNGPRRVQLEPREPLTPERCAQIAHEALLFRAARDLRNEGRMAHSLYRDHKRRFLALLDYTMTDVP